MNMSCELYILLMVNISKKIKLKGLMYFSKMWKKLNNHVVYLFYMSSILHVICSTCHLFYMSSILHVICSTCHLFYMSSVSHVICFMCHLFHMMSIINRAVLEYVFCSFRADYFLCCVVFCCVVLYIVYLPLPGGSALCLVCLICIFIVF